MTPTARTNRDREEEVAATLLECRRQARALPDTDNLDWLVDWANGSRVARLADSLLGEQKIQPAGLKLGAHEPSAQRGLGLTSPLTAPFHEEWLLLDEPKVELDDFVEPRLECEIGFVRQAGRWVPTGCLEIADCRFPGWSARGGQVIADFALNGAMIFGTRLKRDGDTTFRLFRDGHLMLEGPASMTAAQARIPDAAERLEMPRIASGSLHPALPMTPGSWVLEFDSGGATSLLVCPRRSSPKCSSS